MTLHHTAVPSFPSPNPAPFRFQAPKSPDIPQHRAGNPRNAYSVPGLYLRTPYGLVVTTEPWPLPDEPDHRGLTESRLTRGLLVLRFSVVQWLKCQACNLRDPGSDSHTGMKLAG